MNDDYPDWWPENPYPRELFPLEAKDARAAVGDDALLTALSGTTGRFVFEATSRRVLKALQEEFGDLESASDAGRLSSGELTDSVELEVVREARRIAERQSTDDEDETARTIMGDLLSVLAARCPDDEDGEIFGVFQPMAQEPD